LGKDAPRTLTTLGNLALLSQSKTALFCSVRCPGDASLGSYDAAQKLRDEGVTVVSGFHSPVERDCLKTLLRGSQPIIICPARSLTKMRIRAEYKEAYDKGRLLFLSFFRSHRHRSDVQMASRRNRFVAALADRIIFLYAAPSSRTELLCREILGWKKPLFTLNSGLNQNLIALGAQPFNPKEP
jgi:predicted Rossmann fold nucleotide-binding protein DprA/Smf involved in DNA uptake